MNFAIQEYGWDLSYVLDSSILFIMLLMRQKLSIEGKTTLSLLDQEKLDKLGNDKESWEKLVAENHKKFAYDMQ